MERNLRVREREHPLPTLIKVNTTDKKKHILRTALNMFTRQGYFNTSVHDICREAEVSIGSLYHHFKNKEGIAKALFDDVVNDMAENVERIRAQNDSTRECCKAVIGLLFEMAESAPEMMRFVLEARHREFMPDEKPICSSRPFELMLDIVTEGIQRGELCDLHPLVATTGIFGGAIRMIHLRLDGVFEDSLENHLEGVWESAWTGVAG